MKRRMTGQEPASSAGLSADEAARRLAADGPNELHREDGAGPWRLLLQQFTSPLVLLLIGAAVVSGAVGETVDAGAIGAIVVLNAAVGFFQEYRAERALLALRALSAPRARVRRDARTVEVAARDVVVGDLLVLDAGDVIAADARLVEAHALRTVEAALTGESVPVDKRAEPAPEDAPLHARFDSVFMGTAVAAGSALARVEATGMGTQMGQIAGLLAEAGDAQTPLQVQLARVGRALIVLAVVVVGSVAALGLLRGDPLIDVFMVAISLAVAAVPEGLPAIVTIALAVGVRRMAQRHVLVRKLAAVETLGSTTVICTDKTGTLTEGRMVVDQVWGGDPEAVLTAAAACCDAELADDAAGGGTDGTGDPTELALLAAAADRGIRRGDIELETPRVDVAPFDADRKRMSILRADGVRYVKGAPEAVLPHVLTWPDAAGASAAEAAVRDLAERGLRVLAIAVGEGAETEALTLRGLVGMEDPPRAAAVAAVQAARDAGITPVMITGDSPVTARAIAERTGVLAEGEDPAERVHARVTPADKLRIVRDWKERGAVVAMTGDGVNDAPAVAEAHVGIAMGAGGTEVTREAADLVLTDDDFASIVAGIREGRGVTDNIQKTLLYLLAGNVGELLAVLGAMLLSMPIPLLPLQILWLNLVSDGPPALALVVDPPDPDTMKRAPRAPGAPILGRAEWAWIGLVGLVEGALVLGVYAWGLEARGPEVSRDIAFCALVFSQLFLPLAVRSRQRTLWGVGAFGNVRLLGVIALSVLVQVAIHHIPRLRAMLGLVVLPWADLALALVIGLIPVSLVEVTKLVRRAAGAR